MEGGIFPRNGIISPFQYLKTGLWKPIHLELYRKVLYEVKKFKTDKLVKTNGEKVRQVWATDIKSFGIPKVKSLARRSKVPQFEDANFKREITILEKVSEKLKYSEGCVKLPNLYWYCPREVCYCSVQKIQALKQKPSGIADDALPTAHICEGIERPGRIQ
nr:hypothetical protein Iba_chr05dCG7460 [Ipomoea batatas]